MFTDAESLSVRNFIANYKEECFVYFTKNDPVKKINIENCFLVRLFTIYLLKSVLHLKYDKITVINNMQLPHYIDTRAAISTGPIHQHVFAMTYRIKSLLEIYMKFLVS